MIEMINTRINGKWELLLPEHRAKRPEWKTGWEVERLNALRDAIEPGTVVYDIGTEEGDISALMASWGAEMCLFEPNEKAWPNVEAIFRANDMEPYSVFMGFVANETTYPHDIYYAFAHDSDAPIISDHGFMSLANPGDISKITIDEFAEVNPAPDILHIDVEGSELEVLKGAGNTLERHSPLNFCIDSSRAYVSQS